MQTDDHATRDPTQLSTFLWIRSIIFSELPPYSYFTNCPYNMIIRQHHISMLPVDYIAMCLAVCAMGRDESH